MADNKKKTEKKLTGAGTKTAKVNEENPAPATVPQIESANGVLKTEEDTQSDSSKNPVKPAEKRPSGARGGGAKNDPYETLARRYAKYYPSCKVFHITTDKQVFLEENESAARFHQRTILGGGEIKSIKVK